MCAPSLTSFQRPNALRYEKDSSNALLTGLRNTWNADRSITDPTGTDQYDDLVEWNLGKVYEREDVKRTPKGGAIVTKDYQNNEGYQYTHIGNITANLTWDDNGQLTDWDTTDYTWTALGQLEQADVSGETARDYTYDAFGRRVSTKVGSAETRFLYHGWHMIGAYDVSSSKWLWQEIPMSRGEGMLEHIALDTNDLDDDTDVTEYRQYAVHEDWQSTVWAVSDTAGAIVEQYVQDDPFGKSHTLNSSGTDIGDFASKVYHVKRMHGGVTEEVTGLYDFRNRWLSPESGSWLSRDPLGDVDSANLYQGMMNSPISLSDRHGLWVDGWVSGGGYPAGNGGHGGDWVWDGIPFDQEGACPCPGCVNVAGQAWCDCPPSECACLYSSAPVGLFYDQMESFWCPLFGGGAKANCVRGCLGVYSKTSKKSYLASGHDFCFSSCGVYDGFTKVANWLDDRGIDSGLFHQGGHWGGGWR